MGVVAGPGSNYGIGGLLALVFSFVLFVIDFFVELTKAQFTYASAVFDLAAALLVLGLILGGAGYFRRA